MKSGWRKLHVNHSSQNTFNTMKKLLIAVLSLSTLGGFAQKAANPDAYAKTITADDLRRHLYIVASKEMEGRETATPGQRRAAAYIENEFKRLGLQPGNNGSFHQNYPVYQDSLVNAVLEVNGVKYQLDKDFNAALTNFPGMMAFSEVVFIGPNVTADSIRKMNLAGRLLLVAPDAPAAGTASPTAPRGFQSPRIMAVRSANAAAFMTIANNYPQRNPVARKGGMTLGFFKRSYGPQTFAVSQNVAKAITGSDDVNGMTSAKIYQANVLLDVQKATQNLQSSNVLGVIPGTDKSDEYLIITAHYDHIGKRDTVINYGADDDGSGTVSVLEIAEAFSKARAEGKLPRRTVVFMTVSGEEKGLWGSDYYGSHPVYPLAKTTANLNIDMIGRMDPERKVGDSTNYVYVIGDDKLSSDLRPISEAANKKVKLELDYKFNGSDPNRFYYRSDHYNFAKHGVPIIFYFNGTHADYHRPTDTPDKINYPLMAKRAQLVFYTAWDMANRNDMLKRDMPMDQSIFNR
jgi:hypothetical protein